MSVHNDSAYVVRMGLEVQINPLKQTGLLPRTYILPGEVLTLNTQGPVAEVSSVVLQPATTFGFAVDDYQADVLGHGR